MKQIQETANMGKQRNNLQMKEKNESAEKKINEMEASNL